MEQELELLKRFKEDSGWFHENIDKLRMENFTGKFVAIKDSKPIASGEDFEKMLQELENKGENPSYLFIEFVHPAGFTLIL